MSQAQVKDKSESKDFSIERSRLQLVDVQPFYATVLQLCLFSWNEAVKTAGVGLDSLGRVRLLVAPSFWLPLSEDHRVGLLMHEMLHLIMKHLYHGKDLDPQTANIAMDMAINQYIPKHLLPKGGVLPEKFNLPYGKDFNFYYLKLLDDKNTQGASPLDNHGDLSEMIEVELSQGQGGKNQESSSKTQLSAPSTSKEMEAIAVNELLEKAMAVSKPGDIPMHVKERFLEMQAEKSKQQWKNLLKRYMGRFLSGETETTRNRPNRRMGFRALGSKRLPTPEIMMACDQSGSMHDKMVMEVMNEAKAILKVVSEKTEVVYFDTEIAHKEVLSSIHRVERYASGGTNFDCVIKYANEKRPDCLIMLTDGEANVSITSKVPIIWVINNRSADREYFRNLKGEKVFLNQAKG